MGWVSVNKILYNFALPIAVFVSKLYTYLGKSLIEQIVPEMPKKFLIKIRTSSGDLATEPTKIAKIQDTPLSENIIRPPSWI